MGQPAQVEYVPPMQAMALADFPASIQPHAKRDRFAGVGTASAPIIYGWIVVAHDGRNGGVSGDEEAKAWLKKNGFTYSGRKWFLRDDIANGIDITTTWSR